MHIFVIICRTPHYTCSQPISSEIQICLPTCASSLSVLSLNATQRSVFQENASKREETRHRLSYKLLPQIINLFLLTTIALSQRAKYEFKVTVHYGLWTNAHSCDPLNHFYEKLMISFSSQS